MSGSGLGRVSELFFAALELAPRERAAFLDQACGDDTALRAEVDRLVAADEVAGSLFDVPVGAVFGRSGETTAPGRARETLPGNRRETSPDVPRPPLPNPVASLVGREREVRIGLELLAENRLVTLMGAPGIGKTRLALRIAEMAAEAFAGRVRVVEVADVDDPERLASEVATALGVRAEAGRPIEDAVRAEMRRKRLLLVLDGCERLASACAALAEAVLHAGARARVLATSREALDVPGEAVWHVPPLDVPPANAADEDAPTSEAVRLFVERARLHRPDFELAGRTALAAVDICRRLDGIPLAIELAAARVKTLPVEQILAKLDDPFRLLAGGGRNASPRHRSMRAAIDWSYERLSPEERELFRALSALEGEFTLADAFGVGGQPSAVSRQLSVVSRQPSEQPSDTVGIAGDQRATDSKVQMTEDGGQRTADSGRRTADSGQRTADVLDVLTRLVEKSLVLVEEHGEESQYRMYGVIRAYAREKLAAGIR